jgi:hypothetical protein
MLELTEIPQTARERIEEIGAADLVIGIFAPFTPESLDLAVTRVHECVARLYAHVRTVIVHATDQPARADEDVRIVSVPALRQDYSADPTYSISDSYHGLFAVGESLHAKAACVILSDLESVTADWMYSLVRPALELNFDLVTPCYSHGRYEGLLNSGMIAPFTRALYGKQIEHPLGPDFAFSSRLLSHFVAKASRARNGTRSRSLAAIMADAACDGFEICQAGVGARHYPSTDWNNQSSVLAQILHAVFHEAEIHAPQWQRVRGSEAVPTFGERAVLFDQHEALDLRRMIESFQLGYRNLQEIWSAVLPPGTLLELTKLARLAPEQFRMPDRLWARVVYDFAVGYRVRTISQDHLIRAMTPLYLAWVASYAIDPSAGIERLEQLGLAFEAAKPYILSRWRWPDRFNP